MIPKVFDKDSCKSALACLMLIFMSLSLNIIGQVTRVRGSISDKNTTEPLAFVNLMFMGTTIGTNSDINGNFDLTVHKSIDTLLVSYLGYKAQKIKILPNKVNELKIQLEAAETMLKVVEILPGENPAHRIMREVVANKGKNSPEFVDSYKYRVYNKVQLDMNNYGDKLSKRKAIKSVNFVFNYADTTEEGKIFLPVAISESTSDIYYTRSPERKQELILGSKISGLKNASVSQLLGDMYQNINIYDNFLVIFNRSFVSPVTDNFLRYYKYYLIDSVYIDEHRCYKLLFLPKRKQDLTFTGDLYIDDKTWGVKQVNIRFNEQANVNYIKSFHVFQDYRHVDDKTWMLQKEQSVGDFAPFEKADGIGFFGRKTTIYNKFKINPNLPDSLFNLVENVKLSMGADNLDASAWDSLRYDTLNTQEARIYEMVDSVVKVPFIINLRNTIELLATGYLRWGQFQIGKVLTFASWNSIEGPRLKFGLITDRSFSKRIELNAELAYGFSDRRFKGKLGFRAFLKEDKKHRNLLSTSYKSDLEQLSLSPNSVQIDNLLFSIFRRNSLQYVTNVEELKVSYEYDHFQGFSHVFSVLNRKITPLGDFVFQRVMNDEATQIKNITTTEFSLQTRFAWKEKYILGAFDEAAIKSDFPILQLDLTMAHPKILGSEFKYYKARFRVSDRIRLSPYGYSDCLIDLGKIWGKAPFPFLELHPGSQTYAMDRLAFNMMSFFDFTSDRYASLFVDHHFDGYFLNKIPLLRKLKWREVFTLKTLIGDMRDANRDLLNYPGGLDPQVHRPYVETGFAVENIFKLVRIDFLWRMTHLERPQAKPFGLRTSLVFRF
jgi:hypothetical protein